MIIKDRQNEIDLLINTMGYHSGYTDEDINRLFDELDEMRMVTAWLNNEWSGDVKVLDEDCGSGGRQYIELVNHTDQSFRLLKLYLKAVLPDGTASWVVAESGPWPAHSLGRLYLDQPVPNRAELIADGEMIEYELR